MMFYVLRKILSFRLRIGYSNNWISPMFQHPLGDPRRHYSSASTINFWQFSYLEKSSVKIPFRLPRMFSPSRCQNSFILSLPTYRHLHHLPSTAIMVPSLLSSHSVDSDFFSFLPTYWCLHHLPSTTVSATQSSNFIRDVGGLS